MPAGKRFLHKACIVYIAEIFHFRSFLGQKTIHFCKHIRLIRPQHFKNEILQNRFFLYSGFVQKIHGGVL